MSLKLEAEPYKAFLKGPGGELVALVMSQEHAKLFAGAEGMRNALRMLVDALGTYDVPWKESLLIVAREALSDAGVSLVTEQAAVLREAA